MLLAAGMPIWMLLMSLSQFVIIGAWLMDGDIKGKIKKAFSNPVIQVISGLYAIHLLGLLYTTDFDYAIRDLRIKLPLFLLPVIFSSMPTLPENKFQNVLKVIILSTFISTLCSMAIFLGWTSRPVVNIRDISPFISHIRLALIICVGVVSMIYLLKKDDSLKLKFIYIPLMLWFIVFLVILESLTGIFILLFLFIFFSIIYIWKSEKRFFRPLFSACLILLLFAIGMLYKFLFIDSIKEITIDAQSLKNFTTLGHPYEHFPEKKDHENGNLVWINICESELDS